MSRQVDNSTFEKKQGDLLDYTNNLGDNWLGSDTIATSTWTVQSPLYEVANTFDDDGATIWVSGGVVGQTYSLDNVVTTAGGRIKKERIYVRIKADDA